MNILYLCDEYPPGPHGGIGTSVQLLARQMVKLGHTVVVAGIYSPGYGGPGFFEDEGVQVYRFFTKIDTHRLEQNRNFAARAYNWLLKHTRTLQADIEQSLESYRLQLHRLIDKYQIDIAEIPDYHDYMRFCLSYVPFPDLPVSYVVKMNGSMTYFAREAGMKPALHIMQMERNIIENAAAVAGVSSYVAQKSAECFEYDRPVTILPNGIDTNETPSDQPRDPLQVIFTGSLVAKKGIYQLATAWNTVSAAIPAARLLILGKGSQQSVKQHLKNGAAGTVIFKGHVDRTILYDDLKASAVAIFPSYAEAFALAPLEAMACGTAVINSNRTSGPELIRHEMDGMLIDPDDTGALAGMIIRLLSDSNLRNRLAKSGVERVKSSFDIQKIASRNIEFYQEVLSSKL